MNARLAAEVAVVRKKSSHCLKDGCRWYMLGLNASCIDQCAEPFVELERKEERDLVVHRRMLPNGDEVTQLLEEHWPRRTRIAMDILMRPGPWRIRQVGADRLLIELTAAQALYQIVRRDSNQILHCELIGES